jgi:regulator of protease activity HflC (stomatin/prohibitin superfamily)
MTVGKAAWICAFGTFALIVLGFFISGGRCNNINAGEVGVRFNEAHGEASSIVQPRTSLYMPWERLIVYPSSLYTSSFTKNDTVHTLTRSGTVVNLDTSVSWLVQSGDLMTVFENFGERTAEEISEGYIRPLTYAVANEVVGKLDIEEVLVKKRAKMSNMIKTKLITLLEKRGITVEDVNVGEVWPDQSVVATRNALRDARNRLEQLTRNEQTVKEEVRAIITNAERIAKENELRTNLTEQVRISKIQEIARIKARRFNGSKAVIGPKPPPVPPGVEDEEDPDPATKQPSPQSK